MDTSGRQTPGARFRAALEAERPLQIPGVVNAYAALLATHAGFRALYLSGSGVAAASHGLPDLGMTSLAEVVEDARRITAVTDLPLLVDADTGWGHELNVARAVRELTRAGAAGMHLEDQVEAKRCGHRPGKELVTIGEMRARLRAALDARPDETFLVIARTDAIAVEGLDRAAERAVAYRDEGVDAVFVEAVEALDHYRVFVEAVGVPVVANLTEFGRTPLFHVDELRGVGVAMALYPLSAFRAMSRAAWDVYTAIRADGTQRGVIDAMHTRDEVYQHLGYPELERRLDERRRDDP